MRGLLITGNIALLLIAFMQEAYAQPMPPVNAPIDGGIFTLLLLAGGGALAANKIRRGTKRRNK